MPTWLALGRWRNPLLVEIRDLQHFRRENRQKYGYQKKHPTYAWVIEVKTLRQFIYRMFICMLRKLLLGLSLSLSMLGVGAAVSSKPAMAAYPGATSCDKNEVSTNYDRNFSRGQFVSFGCGDKLAYFQNDGNLVVYKYNWNIQRWEPKWATGTWDGESSDMRAARFSIQADGNIVLYNYQNKAIWATMTNGNRGVQLVMQNDGNWVVYTNDGRAIWATMTNGGTQRTFSAARDMQNRPVKPVDNLSTRGHCMMGGSCAGGSASQHNGVDYFVGAGSEVRATCDGEVVHAYSKYTGIWDRFTVIKHTNCGGYQTVYGYYGHINPSVSPGQTVRKGQAIGSVASWPGNDHLHFSLKTNYVANGWGYSSKYTNLGNDGWIDPESFRRNFNW
jgi:murein DD-endopeptidase MepM/ murein hydrolase activator NlpD